MASPLSGCQIQKPITKPPDPAGGYLQGAAAPHLWIWAKMAVSQLCSRQAPKQNPCSLLTQSSGHRENTPPVALRAQILHPVSLFPYSLIRVLAMHVSRICIYDEHFLYASETQELPIVSISKNNVLFVWSEFF